MLSAIIWVGEAGGLHLGRESSVQVELGGCAGWEPRDTKELGQGQSKPAGEEVRPPEDQDRAKW